MVADLVAGTPRVSRLTTPAFFGTAESGPRPSTPPWTLINVYRTTK
ncbi:MAG: hypothetical protein HOZ81_17985 [Streptomyces sp.]|nr:hypothetical protein [Streptomyces sp.]